MQCPEESNKNVSKRLFCEKNLFEGVILFSEEHVATYFFSKSSAYYLYLPTMHFTCIFVISILTIGGRFLFPAFHFSVYRLGSSRARLPGWIFLYICCIFVHPDLALVPLFVRMQERSFLQLTEPLRSSSSALDNKLLRDSEM